MTTKTEVIKNFKNADKALRDAYSSLADLYDDFDMMTFEFPMDLHSEIKKEIHRLELMMKFENEPNGISWSEFLMKHNKVREV